MPDLQQQIRGHLATYLLLGGETLDEFEDWFVLASWNARKETEPATLALIAEIELRLAEYSSGHWDKGELHQHFLGKVAAGV